MVKRRLMLALLFMVGVVFAYALQPAGLQQRTAQAQARCQMFPETGKTLCDKFLTYWENHGSIGQQGYPISNSLTEVSDVDGRTYTVQYFERAVFEAHPENTAPNDIQLSLLGAMAYKANYPHGAPTETPNSTAGSQLVPETGKHLGGQFLQYWQTHGGLAQQGYPISEEFMEVSRSDGKPYLVQYFERAEFQMHPENQAPNNVLLAQLGTFRYDEKYPSGSNSGGQVAQPVPTPGDQTPAQPSEKPSSFSGSSETYDITTAAFHLAGGNYKVDWSATSASQSGGMFGAFLISEADPDFYPEGVADNSNASSGTTSLKNIATGSYNFKVFSVDVNWTLTIYPVYSPTPTTTATATSTPIGQPSSTSTTVAVAPTNTSVSVEPTSTAQPTSPPAPPRATDTSVPAPPRPTDTEAPPPPRPTATTPSSGQRCGAICRDGTHSDATGSGACSHHGGVDHWLYCNVAP